MRPDDDCTHVSDGRVAPVRPGSGDPEGAGEGALDMLEIGHERAAPGEAAAPSRLSVRSNSNILLAASTPFQPSMVMKMMRIMAPVVVCMVSCPGGAREQQKRCD